jgi:hypothetical protein
MKPSQRAPSFKNIGYDGYSPVRRPAVRRYQTRSGNQGRQRFEYQFNKGFFAKFQPSFVRTHPAGSTTYQYETLDIGRSYHFGNRAGKAVR